MIAEELAILTEDAQTMVSSGLAIHINPVIAIELVIIAGLPWELHPELTMNALAHGWLRLAHVPVWTSDIDGGTFSLVDNCQITSKHTGRAAAYAELAVCAARRNRTGGSLNEAISAWDFIANGPLSPEQAAPIMRKLDMMAHEFTAFAIPMADHYRRELIQLKG